MLQSFRVVAPKVFSMEIGILKYFANNENLTRTLNTQMLLAIN